MEEDRAPKKFRFITSDPWDRIETALEEGKLPQLDQFETKLKRLEQDEASLGEEHPKSLSVDQTGDSENILPEDFVAFNIRKCDDKPETITLTNSTFTLCSAFPPGLTCCYTSALRTCGAFVMRLTEGLAEVESDYHVTSMRCQKGNQCSICRLKSNASTISTADLETSLRSRIRTK